jgi:trans-aconitate methyltransferase
LFDRADGVELSEAMCDIAAAKVPDATVYRADMRDFDLGRTYDAVLCLCYSIGYSTSVDELNGTVARLAAHTTPGGVCVVEPWWFPERFLHGFVTASHSVRDGDASRMTIRYVVADAAGIEDFTQVEVHSLFTREEYLAAFEHAGLAAEYREGGPNGRGLFIAHHS